MVYRFSNTFFTEVFQNISKTNNHQSRLIQVHLIIFKMSTPLYRIMKIYYKKNISVLFHNYDSVKWLLNKLFMRGIERYYCRSNANCYYILRNSGSNAGVLNMCSFFLYACGPDHWNQKCRISMNFNEKLKSAVIHYLI